MPQGRLWRKVAAALWVVATLGACSKQREPYTMVSEPVQAPTGSRWQSARVEIHFQPRRARLVQQSTSKRVTYTLLLTAGGQEQRIKLDELLEGDRLGYSSPREFAAMAKPKLALDAAPDGHALALSFDGGKRWRYLGLDGSDGALYCRHWTFEGTAGSGLWNSAPTTRQVAMDILASASPQGKAKRAHRQPGEPPRFQERFDREVIAATRWAQQHLDDAEVRRVVRQATLDSVDAVRVGKTLQPLLRCLGAAAARDESLLDQVVAALGSHGETGNRAIRALQYVSSAKVQAALLAQWQAMPSDAAQCQRRVWLMSALAAVTARLGSADEALEEALIAAANDAAPCTGNKARSVRVEAIRGLAAAASPRVVDTLRKLAAAERCPATFERWREGYDWDRPNLDADDPHRARKLPPAITAPAAPPVSCWAKAALAQLPAAPSPVRPGGSADASTPASKASAATGPSSK